MMLGKFSALATIAIMILAAPLLGQYRVHSWHSFEQGFPPELAMGHYGSHRSVFAFPYQQQGVTLPSAMTSESARREIGFAGVRMVVPSAEQAQVSIFSPTTLARNQLGANGAALYQADIYIPEQGVPMPSAALLAGVPKEDKSLSYAFYRFGILEDGETVFFSFANNTPAPLIYQSQKLSELNVSRPGWHRFQIIFKGQNEIYCAIDGQFTKFSPIREATLTHLNAGLMVSAQKNHPVGVVADNLSIQWTNEDVPLPDSPWLDSRRRSTGTTMVGQASSTPASGPSEGTSLLDENPHLKWYTDPSTSWSAAKAQNKPLLVMFYAPRIEPYAYLRGIVPNDQETRDFLSQFTLLKVDANQLAGGQLAQDRRIVRLPTFVIFGLDGQEKTQVQVINKQTTWPGLKAQLTP